MDVQTMIPNYQDTERYKKSKSLESSMGKDAFELAFRKIFGVDENRPKVKCKMCGTEYKNEGNTVFYFNLPDRGLCVDCFKEELQHRDLNPDEIESLAQDYVLRRHNNPGIVGPGAYLPEALTTKQKEIVYKRINQIFDEESQKKEQEIQDKYYKEALQLIGDETDLTTVVAKLMRRMDEKDEENHYSRDPLRMRFG